MGGVVTDALDTFGPVEVGILGEPGFEELCGHFGCLHQAAACAKFATCFGHSAFSAKGW